MNSCVRTFRVTALSIAASAVAVVSAFAQDSAQAGAQTQGEITYAKEVSRLLHTHCADCHHPGGIGPFSLLTYRQAKGWGEMIKEVVQERRMPPWHADPSVGKFKNDRRLTDREIETIVKWVDGGRPLGDEADLPKPPRFSEDWRIPTPDAVFEIPREVTIQPSGVVPYQEFEVPTGFTEDKYIRAMEAMAGNPKVVHHIIVFMRAPGMDRGETAEFQRIGRGFLCGFAPGTIPTIFEPGYAVRVPAGATLIFQMHYTPTGKTEVDRSRFGVVFANEPPKHEIITATTVNFEFEIPPNEPNHRVEAESILPSDAMLFAMTPHMHYRGKSFEYLIRYPDGRTDCLLKVPNYDFNWQTTYILEEPALLPKGTRIQTVAHFDNSANNPYNPDPSKRVRWGEQTWEEMMIGWMDLAWLKEGELQKLSQNPPSSTFGGTPSSSE